MNQPSNYFIGQSGKLMQFSHKVPTFVEESRTDWVVWGQEKGSREDRKWNNLYGDYLIWLYNSSAKNNAIINGKNTYVVGEGWGVKYLTEASKQNLETKLKANAFIGELEESKITRDLSLDRILFGGFAAEMIPNKKNTGGGAHHIDFSKIRVGKKEYHETGESKGKIKPRIYYFTSDWTTRKPEDNPDWTVFYEFPWDWSELDKSKKYLVYYKDYRPDLGDYPLPEYIGAIPYIAADYEISNFTYNNVRNGFSGGYLVNFYNGSPTEVQKAQIELRFDEALTGTDNAGKVVKSFNEDKDSGVEITPLQANGQDDRFINLNEQIRDEIYTGHNFNPTLIGLKNSTGFNNNADELRVASEMLQTTYVTKQQRVFEDFFNALARINDVSGEFFIQRLESVSEQVSEATMAQVLTTNELRERLGLEPLSAEINKVAESLATLSPLLATKVLATMSAEEIRSLVGLTGGVAKTTETTSTEFSKEDDSKIIAAFANCGIEDSELIEIDSRELFAESTEDADNQGHRFKFESKKANALLGVINADPSQTKPQLRELTGLTEKELNDLILELENDGLLEDGIPTEEGSKVKPEVFVVYKYGLRAGQSTKILKTTRPFCENLVKLSKTRSWTILDIQAMNNEQGLDVFTSRGGFWHDKKTDITHNFCRHIWIQKLVTRK